MELTEENINNAARYAMCVNRDYWLMKQALKLASPLFKGKKMFIICNESTVKGVLWCVSKITLDDPGSIAVAVPYPIDGLDFPNGMTRYEFKVKHYREITDSDIMAESPQPSLCDVSKLFIQEVRDN